MRTRTAILLALFALIGGGNAVWSQGTTPSPVPPGDPRGPLVVPSPLVKRDHASPTEVYLTDHGHGGLSDWITYRRAGCAQHGWDPDIQTEIYLRSGAAFPISGTFGDILDAGWMIQGGGKALFFDDDFMRAWFADISLANINASTNSQANTRPVTIGGQSTIVTTYNRTFVGLGAGRQWYLLGTGKEAGPNWRVSVDGGGRWGSASARFTTVKHRSDVIGGIYVGLQTDMEFPMQLVTPCAACAQDSPCVFILGLRTEWAYTWSDILQRQSDVQDISLLAHFGVRY